MRIFILVIPATYVLYICIESILNVYVFSLFNFPFQMHVILISSLSLVIHMHQIICGIIEFWTQRNVRTWYILHSMCKHIFSTDMNNDTVANLLMFPLELYTKVMGTSERTWIIELVRLGGKQLGIAVWLYNGNLIGFRKLLSTAAIQCFISTFCSISTLLRTIPMMNGGVVVRWDHFLFCPKQSSL